MAKPRGRSVHIVQTKSDDGHVTEHSTQDGVEQAIWKEIHGNRFFLAEQAPICQGRLRGEFGYLAESISAKKVLDNTYEFRQEFDQSTKELLQECARFRQIVPENSVNTRINGMQWQQRWRTASEKTSSSISGLHFGHYKAGAASDSISHFHALKTTIALQRGIALTRWKHGLSVMLEKMFGCTLVEKLRAILLMEADFNCSNKIIFGDRMMHNVRSHGLMPEEIYSERGKMADDGSLAKVLFYDIIRQARISAALSSIDAANCYDSVAHAMASIIFRALGVPQEAVTSMFIAIQNMMFFLRTAYGDSTNFAGSTILIKYQGLCQGNGAAPAGWAVISITILGAHKRKGHGAYFRCPITQVNHELAAILFVDDTDILHVRMDEEETVTEAHSALQESINSWGGLLLATGGAFKPIKCFYHLMSFRWKPNGEWSYENNHEDDNLLIGVPMPDGPVAQIEHLPVDTAKETLGVWTSPTGCNKKAIQAMQNKAQEWIDRAKEGNMRQRDIWFLTKHQLWPKVSYGLCSNTAKFADLETALQKQYFQLVPLGGIIRSAPVSLRQLDVGFFGAGCPHVGVECTIAQVNKLMMHYGCPSNNGRKLGMSLGFLTLELGLTLQPLQESFVRYSSWVTHCWLKSLWEKCHLLQITIEFNDVKLSLPRARDKWLMHEFIQAGYPAAQLARLNRVRKFQQVVFLSCVLGASGKHLEKKYLLQRPANCKWSTLKYPTEKPPRKDFVLWKEALRQIVPECGIQDRLGDHLHKGYKIWEWRVDRANGRLTRSINTRMTVYRRSPQARYFNRANRWDMTRRNQPADFKGTLCTVDAISDKTVCIESELETPLPRLEIQHNSFLDVLAAWGQTWMWDSLKVVGDEDWIHGAIKRGSLRAVTDGSYIRELYPDICSASFVLECAEGKGRIVGDFADYSTCANAYRGELLGLLSIHLILLAVNEVEKNLTGSVSIYSDCLGALGKVATLPTTRVPCRSKHADILKIIMIHCQNFTFSCRYAHVKAHQDDHAQYENLSRPAQLNCMVDMGAKTVIWKHDKETRPAQAILPLEPVAIIVGKEKLTTDSKEVLRFHAHRQVAKVHFYKWKLLIPAEFEEVDWNSVSSALHSVPRMFATWACKQVNNVAGTNIAQSRYKPDHSPKCPSCGIVNESCAHILFCEEVGRVDAMMQTIGLLDTWLLKVGSDSGLRRSILDYARGRGGRSMTEITGNRGRRFRSFAKSQDIIGWRRFMEGMVSKELIKIQTTYYEIHGGKYTPTSWVRQLVIQLLEITHGQWLYRNVQVHDNVSGIVATERKEKLQEAIETQILQGGEGLAEEDKYLLDIRLDDLESTSGETQEYWLLAIQAARDACILRSEQAANGDRIT